MKRRKLSKAEREYRRGRRIFAYIAACASLVTALTGYISGLKKDGILRYRVTPVFDGVGQLPATKVAGL